MTELPRIPKLAVEEAGFPKDFDPSRLDLADPDMWTALYLQPGADVDDGAKADLLRSMRRRSRRVLLPLLRPFARVAIALLTVVNMIVPRRWSAPRFLHWLICRGLRRWAAPEANRLILRHFHIGTEILAFIRANVPGAPDVTKPLRPKTLADLDKGDVGPDAWGRPLIYERTTDTTFSLCSAGYDGQPRNDDDQCGGAFIYFEF